MVENGPGPVHVPSHDDVVRPSERKHEASRVGTPGGHAILSQSADADLDPAGRFLPGG